MCLVTFIKDKHPDYPLIFLANRDELYNRPAAPIHRWTDHPFVTAGIDLKEFGTWLGYTYDGQFIALLNDPFTGWEPTVESPNSRGALLHDYLTKNLPLEQFEKNLRENRTKYNGFHLVYGTLHDLRYYSNVNDIFDTFGAGLHTIANTNDDLSGHRKNRSGELLQNYVDQNPDNITLEALTAILADQQLPETMEDYPKELDYDMAMNNSSIFIQGEEFGTVSSTAILLDHQGKIKVREVKYNQTGVTEITTKEQMLDI